MLAQQLPSTLLEQLADSAAVNPEYTIQTITQELAAGNPQFTNNATTFTHLSTAQLVMGDLENAKLTVTKGWSINPNHPGLLSNYGKIHTLQGQSDTASIYFQRAAEVYYSQADSLNYYKTLNNLATARSKLNDFAGALDAIKAPQVYFAREDLENEYNQTRFNESIYLASLGETEKARTIMLELEKVISSFNPYYQGILLLNLAVNHEETQEFQRAATYYERAEANAELMGNDRLRNSCRINRGIMAFNQKKYGEALGRLLAIDSTELIAYKDLQLLRLNELSRIYEQLGDFKNAVLYSRSAAKLNKEILGENIQQQVAEAEARLQVVEAEGQRLKAEAQLREQELIASKQRSALLLGGTGLIALLGLAGLLNRQRRREKRDKLAISEQRDELDELYEERRHTTINQFNDLIFDLRFQQEKLTTKGGDPLVLQSIEQQLINYETAQRMMQKNGEGNLILAEFLKEFTDKIIAARELGGQRIELNLDVPPLSLAATQVTRIGSIINELITNSFKHGARKNEVLPLQLTAEQLNEKQFRLQYADAGPAAKTASIQSEFSSKSGIGIILGITRRAGGKIEHYGTENFDYTAVFTIKD